MIGTTLKKVSKARSSNERILAFSLWLSLLASGMYFKEAWFILGGILGLYALDKGILGFLTLRQEVQGSYDLRSRVPRLRVELPALGLTDFVLLGMAGLSALGLLRPVQVEEGLIEVLRWLVYWLIFRLATEVRQEGYSSERLLVQVQWAAIAVAVLGWLPWAGLIWPAPPVSEAGRLSSVFGYPNVAAAFFGAAFFLPGSNILFKAFLAVSFLSTGSRAALMAVLVVLALKGLKELGARRQGSAGAQAVGPLIRIIKIILVSALIISVSVKLFPNAWEHFRSWNPLSPSIGQRLLYYRDGLSLAWQAQGWPRAGGWLAFPTVQSLPYWTSHPHSAFIHILLNQGIMGLALMGAWAVRAWRRLGAGAEKWALLFLVFHSLLDADFAFGALGLVFWLLSGLNETESSSLSFYQTARRGLSSARRNLPSARLLRAGIYVLAALYLLFLSGAALIQPDLLNPGQVLSREAERLGPVAPRQSALLWQQSLRWDQTRISWRRHLAELELAQGDVGAGLRAVEEALAWRSFDLNAYEWAQGAVLKAADARSGLKGDKLELAQKGTDSITSLGVVEPKSALKMLEPKPVAESEEILSLYRWAQAVPDRIEDKRGRISPFVGALWPEWANFRPTPVINFLAEYARDRQRTTANS
ncbi:hypothetical protein JCM15765_22980 [Paradesulfitobacterium aromaticivorans]